jgi:hypothetical protein
MQGASKPEEATLRQTEFKKSVTFAKKVAIAPPLCYGISTLKEGSEAKELF